MSASLENLMVSRPTGGAMPLNFKNLAAAASRWGGTVRVLPADTPNVAFSIAVRPEGQTGFTIDVDSAHDSVSADGTTDQNADVAIWLLSLMPEDAPRVIAYDQAWSQHVDLTPGITLEQLHAKRPRTGVDQTHQR